MLDFCFIIAENIFIGGLMMQTRATHFGTCQACGATQKLPGGVLAKHGYTVQWGFFNGTCPGSGRRPFETHTDFIEQCIVSAKNNAEGIRASVAELLKPATEPKGWRHHHQVVGRKSAYVWRLADIVTENEQLMLVVGDWKRSAISAGSWYGVKDALDLATKMNAEYAKHLEGTAKKIDTYAAWQEKRVAEWQRTELRPIEGEGTEPKKMTVRTKGARVSVFIGSGKPRQIGTVIATSRDYFMNSTVRFDDGSVATVRTSWTTLAE